MNTTKKIALSAIGLMTMATPTFAATANAIPVDPIGFSTTTPDEQMPGGDGPFDASGIYDQSNVGAIDDSAASYDASPSNMMDSEQTSAIQSDGQAGLSSQEIAEQDAANAGQAKADSAAASAQTSTPEIVKSISSSAKVTSSGVTRYTDTDLTNYAYSSRSSSASKGSIVAPLTPVKGNLYSDGSFVVTSGTYAGKTLLSTRSSNSYNSYETRQWQNANGTQAIAPSNNTVKRYAVTNRVLAPLRASASYSASITNRINSGTMLAGQYVNSHWFKITAGPYAGKYISSGILYTGSSQSVVNGKLSSSDLCSVPSALRQTTASNSASMGCEALQQLMKTDASMAKATNIHVREWEGYRTLATQQQYFRLYGTPQAAVPGTSNHGLGVAMDMNYGGVLSWSSPQVVNMTKYGAANGWVKPTYLRPSGGWNGEPWHFEFNG